MLLVVGSVDEVTARPPVTSIVLRCVVDSVSGLVAEDVVGSKREQ